MNEKDLPKIVKIVLYRTMSLRDVAHIRMLYSFNGSYRITVKEYFEDKFHEYEQKLTNHITRFSYIVRGKIADFIYPEAKERIELLQSSNKDSHSFIHLIGEFEAYCDWLSE